MLESVSIPSPDIMLPSDFTHNTLDENNHNVDTRPSFSAFRFNTTPEPPDHDVSRNHSTAVSTAELTSRQWMPTPEPMTPVEDRPRSDSTTLCSTPEMSVRIRKAPIITEQMVEEDDVQAPPPRDFRRSLASMVFDLIIAVASLYFVAFAVLASVWNGMSASDPRAQALLNAAKIGPTIFPIVFALIVARTLKAVAAWRLEQGATVGLLECLMGSRSFAPAFIAPFKLRAFNIFVPVLILLWAFSPAGGQSALRIVALRPSNVTSITTLQYLDIGNSEPDFSSESGNVNAAFTAALMSPPTSKNGPQDVFGNLQIPMLEAISHSSTADEFGWFDTSATENRTHASIFGIPLTGIPSNANSTFTIQTSYFSLACIAEPKPVDSTTSQILTNDSENGFVSNGQSMAITFDPAHNSSSTEARSIGFISFSNDKLTAAVCNLTTAYVEASVFCNPTRSCAVQAIRESMLDHPSASLSVLDQGNESASNFFAAFVNATTLTRPGSATALENYFVNPAFPFSSPAEPPILADQDNDVFSVRFAQLLNTYWLASIAPIGLMGSFSATDEEYQVASTTANVTTAEDILRVQLPWMLLLLVSSGIMFLAGCMTAVLDVLRRSPDVLDDVKGSLRGSPFVRVESGSGFDDRKAVVRVMNDTDGVLEIGRRGFGKEFV